MEIKIDTEKDSKETIKKVIDLLRTFVDGDISSFNPGSNHPSQNFNDSTQNNDVNNNNDSGADPYTPPSNDLFSIFDSSNDSNNNPSNNGDDDKNKNDFDNSYQPYNSDYDEDKSKDDDSDLDLDFRRKKEKEDEEKVNIIPY